eukprot:m.61400 g.61400  ORF g.61400 m.61400 type:complete len:943 (-) comp9557_c0_seq1:41-2869(-)
MDSQRPSRRWVALVGGAVARSQGVGPRRPHPRRPVLLRTRGWLEWRVIHRYCLLLRSLAAQAHYAVCWLQLQLQFYHSGQSNVSLPTTAVLTLCAEIDSILRHGLLKSHRESGFYKYARLFTRKDVQLEVEKDKRIKTGIGRGRMWIRLTLNESVSSLESYFRMFAEDGVHRPKFYGPEALLNDPEQLSVAMMLISGLDFLTFDVHFDSSLLDPSSGGKIVPAAVVGGTTGDARPPPSRTAFPSAVLPGGRTATGGDGDGGAIDVSALVAVQEDDLLHSHVAAKPKKKGKRKRKKQHREPEPEPADGGPTQPEPTSEGLTPAAPADSQSDQANSRPSTETNSESLVDGDEAADPTPPAVPPAVETPRGDGGPPAVATDDGTAAAATEGAGDADLSEYVMWNKKEGVELDGPALLPWGGEQLDQETLRATTSPDALAPSRPVAVMHLDRIVVNTPDPEGERVVPRSDPAATDADDAAAAAPPIAASPRVRGRNGYGGGGGGGRSPVVESEVGSRSPQVPAASPTLPTSPAPTCGHVEAGAAVEVGCGADVDLVADGNLLLMIKLQIFQQDDEELLKIVRVGLLRGNSEQAVHLVVTSAALYVLNPPADGGDGGTYQTYGAWGIEDVRDAQSTHGGQGLVLTVRGRRSEHSWRFLTGDADVTHAVIAALQQAAGAAGCSGVSGSSADDLAWARAVAAVVESQDGGASASARCFLGYVEVDPAIYAEADIHMGLLELKEPGFLSSSWRPQFFVLQGRVLAQYGEKRPPAGSGRGRPKSAWSVDDPDFFCRRIDDPEREDCLELGNGSSAITLAGSKHELTIWKAYLDGDEVTVTGVGGVVGHPETGLSWLPSAVILTESHLCVCQTDYDTSQVSLLLSEPIEAVTALRSAEDAPTSVTIEFEEDNDAARQWRLLLKTRPALLELANALSAAWKESFQIDLPRHLL